MPGDEQSKQLWQAVRRNALGTVRMLLEDGIADVNWKNPGEWDFEFKGIWAIRGGVQQYYERNLTPLHVAAFTGNAECLKLLLDAGADVNATTRDNCTATHLAAMKGSEKCIRLLINAGANTSALCRGSTALEVAELRKMDDVADLLRTAEGQGPSSKANPLTADLDDIDFTMESGSDSFRMHK